MKKLLSWLVVFVILVAVVGFFRGWFTVSPPVKNEETNKLDVNLSVDEVKMRNDVKAMGEKAKELKDKVLDGAKNAGCESTTGTEAESPE